MPEKIVYKCAECGGEITDKQYLRSVKEHELKFCSKLCDMEAWKRGIYEYAKQYNKSRPPKPPAASAPSAPPFRSKQTQKEDKPKPTTKGMVDVSFLIGTRGKPLKKKELEEIITLYLDNYSKKQISIATGRSYSTVKYIIDKYERGRDKAKGE